MSMQKFDDQCPGCLPILIDVSTKQPMAEDSPEMQTVRSVWATTTPEEREAFHRFTCRNSREPSVLALFYGVTKRIEDALKARL